MRPINRRTHFWKITLISGHHDRSVRKLTKQLGSQSTVESSSAFLLENNLQRLPEVAIFPSGLSEACACDLGNEGDNKISNGREEIICSDSCRHSFTIGERARAKTTQARARACTCVTCEHDKISTGRALARQVPREGTRNARVRCAQEQHMCQVRAGTKHELRERIRDTCTKRAAHATNAPRDKLRITCAT